MEKTSGIRFGNLISYGIGDLYGGGSFFIIGTLFIIFLTDVVKLSPVQAGMVFVIGKVWDALIDPFLGYLTDRTNSRFGRRRVYFLLGFLPVAVSFALLWVPIRFGSANFLMIYYTLAYIFFCTVFSLVNIPYSALNADMTLDYRERARLSGARMIFSQISALLAGVFPKLIIGKFAEPAEGYLVMGLVFGVFYSIPWLLVYFGTFELPVPSRADIGKLGDFFQSFWTVFRNKSFRIHMGMYLTAYAAMDIMMALFIYYLTYYVQRPEIFSICLGAMVLTQIACLPLHIRVNNSKGSRTAYTLGLAIWGIAMVLAFFLNTTSPLWLILLTCIVIGSGLSAGVMVPWAILPSVVDVDELITTERRAGVYAGMMAFIRQLAQGLTGFMAAVMLDVIDYVPNVPQSPATLLQLRWFFVFGPVVLMILGVLIASRFKITPLTHAEMMKEIERLKQGGTHAEVNPEVRVICEKVTGMSYQQLYK